MLKSRFLIASIFILSFLSFEAVRDLSILNIFKTNDYAYSILEEENVEYNNSSESGGELSSMSFELDLDVHEPWDLFSYNSSLSERIKSSLKFNALLFAQSIIIPPPEFRFS